MPVITVQYKPFGVQLTFMPTVLANGIINLRLAPSVSELNFAHSRADRTASTSRRSTSAKRAPQSSCATARASQSPACCRRKSAQRLATSLDRIGAGPWRAVQQQVITWQQETDLVVIVTPHLVAPAVPGQRLASPLDNSIPTNDVDFFLMGEMEQRKSLQGLHHQRRQYPGPIWAHHWPAGRRPAGLGGWSR